MADGTSSAAGCRLVSLVRTSRVWRAFTLGRKLPGFILLTPRTTKLWSVDFSCVISLSQINTWKNRHLLALALVVKLLGFILLTPAMTELWSVDFSCVISLSQYIFVLYDRTDICIHHITGQNRHLYTSYYRTEQTVVFRFDWVGVLWPQLSKVLKPVRWASSVPFPPVSLQRQVVCLLSWLVFMCSSQGRACK